MGGAFPTLITLAVMAGLLWLAVRPTKGPVGAPLDAGLCALVGGLVGARLGYVLTHTAAFADQVAEILWTWQGGLSGPGAIAGALAGLSLYAALTRRDLWSLADALAAPAASLSLAAWAGCLLDGCAYGRGLAPGPLAPASTDLFGWSIPRWPTQTVGALLSLAALAVLIALGGQRWPAGLLACLALAMISGAALALSFTRADPRPFLGAVPLEALGHTALLALGLMGAAARRPRA